MPGDPPLELRFFDVGELTGELFDEYFSLMSPSKKEKVMRYRFEKDRRLSVAAEMLARQMLSRRTGLREEQIEFEYLPSGKPFAVGLTGVCFSYSHSGGQVFCAVSQRSIGADVELIKALPENVIAKFASEDEKNYIFCLKSVDLNADNSYNHSVNDRALRIWTLKEAYFKCTGEGLRGGLRSVSFTPYKDGFLCSEPGYVCLIPASPAGYVASVVAESD